eukprot:4179184-Pleurochrysis_carterae.AAC.1
MLALAMSQTAGKRDPFLRAMHAEILSKSAAREKPDPFGFCLHWAHSRARSVCENTIGSYRATVTVVGAFASRIDVRMNQRVGRGHRGERNGDRRRRSACVQWADARG